MMAPCTLNIGPLEMIWLAGSHRIQNGRAQAAHQLSRRHHPKRNAIDAPLDPIATNPFFCAQPNASSSPPTTAFFPPG